MRIKTGIDSDTDIKCAKAHRLRLSNCRFPSQTRKAAPFPASTSGVQGGHSPLRPDVHRSISLRTKGLENWLYYTRDDMPCQEIRQEKRHDHFSRNPEQNAKKGNGRLIAHEQIKKLLNISSVPLPPDAAAHPCCLVDTPVAEPVRAEDYDML